jgi:hypothetical protein
MIQDHITIPELSKKDIARFWSHVAKWWPRSCWPWKACVVGGYGQFAVQVNRKNKGLISTRVMYLLSTGKDPGTLNVCRTCDNPICHNPDHLWLGTNEDNMKDMIKKGRGKFPGPTNPACGDRSGRRLYPDKWTIFNHSSHLRPELVRGENNGNAKLTNVKIIEIRSRFASGKATCRQLADEFLVSKAQIYLIVNRKSWKNV